MPESPPLIHFHPLGPLHTNHSRTPTRDLVSLSFHRRLHARAPHRRFHDDRAQFPWCLDESNTVRHFSNHLFARGDLCSIACSACPSKHTFDPTNSSTSSHNTVKPPTTMLASTIFGWLVQCVLNANCHTHFFQFWITSATINSAAATEELLTDRWNSITINAPGHKDFIDMITGAPQDDAASIMVPAGENPTTADAKGYHNAGKSQGQTRQHSRLINLLGMKQIYTDENKMDCDTAGYEQDWYDETSKHMKNLLIKCQHTNIVPIFNVWFTTDTPFCANSSASFL